MTRKDSLPIVVGVTGHRSIRNEDGEALRGAVRRELTALGAKYPHSHIVMLSSLAEGADQLCAEVALEASLPLIAVLPMGLEAYEKDFSAEGLTKLRELCGAAAACFVAPAAEPVPAGADRDFAYRQAGIYVATHAHVLLALWDGKETPPSTCGTAETVRFALDSAFAPTDSIPLGGSCAVVHIQTPRAGDNAAKDAGAVRVLGDGPSLQEILARTDEFNALAAKMPPSESRLLPAKREPDGCLDHMEALYQKADALSLRFARRHRRILAALAIISTVITVAFLLYDEAELHWMILVCGGMLLMAWAVQRYGTRVASHRRYLEYRMLAEALRVQAFLRYAGSGTAVCDILPWSERMEAGWVAAALKTCVIGGEPGVAHSIREPWVEQQRAYHLRSIAKAAGAHRGSERIVKAAFWCSVLLYVAVLVFEFAWGGLLPASNRIADAERYRTLSKLLLGSISAATLFIANYYGRLSLSRVTSDHCKMERFYGAVLERMDRYGQTEELLALIAREELIENGNWCSYQRDNTADFSL